MKWKRSKGRRSRDVIDIRGAEQPAGGAGGGFSMPGGVAGLGGGAGIVVVIIIVAIQAFGGGGTSAGGFDLNSVFGTGAQAPGADDPAPIPPEQDPQRDIKEFSVYVFNDVQKTWEGIFDEDGKTYDRSQLVLYSDAVSTGGCGGATSASGPFYCPADSRVYLDLTFYDEMERALGAPGDFAWAYVIAHEVGHHVQNLTGTNAEVDNLSQDDPDSANELSVRTELQADCYAGAWAATVFAEGDLEEGDIEEAFTATEAIGDDRLARDAGRRVNPDSFTHGTSEQRRTWFDKGFRSGDPSSCDTFSPDSV